MTDISRLPAPQLEVWEWQLQGVCRGFDPSLFFHPEGDRAATARREAAAKAVSASCPVLLACRDHAISVREPYGVWGGLSEPERDELASARPAAARGDVCAPELRRRPRSLLDVLTGPVPHGPVRLGWRDGELAHAHRPRGRRGLDDYLTRDFARNIGAEIMGRNKFGPQRGPWQDHDWRGWWGDEPPFRTPVFVMTHHERPSFTLSDTTFHFVSGDPAAVLKRAQDAAQGKDVRLGGGVRTIRQFLDADLVDTMHVAVSPVKLESGVRLWESPDELLDRFHLEVVPSPSGVTHHLFWRR